MKSLIFPKRKLSRGFAAIFVGVFLTLFGAVFIFRLLNLAYFGFLYIPFALLFIVGVILTFGYQMTDLKFDTNEIKFYYQVLFLKFNSNKVKFEKVNYFFIRDLNLKTSGFSHGNYRILPFYEVSLICDENNRRISLLQTQSKNTAIETIEEIKAISNVEFRDNTFENEFTYLENNEA